MPNFIKAMDLCEVDFLSCLKNNYAKMFISFKWVEQAILKRFEIDESGQIISLPQACTWKEALY